MIILGVAYLSDASACVLRDGQLLSAVSQERLNRKKLWYGVPHQAIEKALEIAGVAMDEVDVIATHGKAPLQPDAAPFARKREAIEQADLPDDVKAAQLACIDERLAHETHVLGERTPGYLKELDRYGKPIHVIEHHTAHAMSAYFATDWDQCYVLTADGWGEDASATVWRFDGGTGKRIGLTHTFDSLGYFYGSITKSLGFTPHRHEGKVLGLAAYCPNPESYSEISRMVGCIPEELRFSGRMENGLYRPKFENAPLDDLVARYSREDIASSTQTRLEEVVTELVDALPGEGLRIALAGGIFANVKLNQRIVARPHVDDIFVFPNMGDGGLSVGAAWMLHHERTGVRPAALAGVTLGNEISQAEAAAELQAGGLDYDEVPDMENRVGELLADGSIVIRVSGAMEFGPRALGNRSILCDASDPGINDSLNKRLHRSEFMPFAPATLAERAGEYYRDIDKAANSACYMTVTYDCHEKMKSESPAAVHVDGTARPQLVDAQTYPGFHAILTRYHELTGKGSVVNTSYNMHEEPIVSSADDAIRAFKESGLPYMALGRFLVRQ